MILRKWPALFSLLLLVAMGYRGLACGWYPEAEEYRFFSFNPFFNNSSVYRPFFFSGVFMNSVQNPAGLQTDRQRNIDEWVAYTHHKVPAKDIYELLYQTDVTSYHATNNNQWQPGNVEANAFYKYLQLPANKQLKIYFDIAKQSEVFCNYWGDPWEEENTDPKIAFGTLKQCHENMLQCKDKFLRQRYAFQFIRLCYYTGDQRGADVYEQEFEPVKTNSIIKPWAMLYYAHLIGYGKQQHMKACYYYSRVFRLCDEKKYAAFNHYLADSIDRILPYAKNNEERADIIALTALARPHRKLNAIKQLMAISPDNPLLQLLITREINKCEDWLLTTQINGYTPAVRTDNNPNDWVPVHKYSAEYHSDHIYANQLLVFLKNCCTTKKYSSNAFIHIATGHMAFVTGNDSLALYYLNTAQKQQQQIPLTLQTQLRLTTLMAQARLAPKIDDAFEARILESINWLSRQPGPEAQKLLDQFLSFLSNNYLHQGEVIKAALCRSRSHRLSNLQYISYPSVDGATGVCYEMAIYYFTEHATTKDCGPAINYVTGKNKTPFQRWLTQPFSDRAGFINNLYDVTGTVYLRNDSLQLALGCFKKLPATYWKPELNDWPYQYSYLDANGFYAHFGSNHRKCAADTVQYNKYTFVKELLRLKTQVNKGNATFDTHIKIAHAYYNITNYGNSWQMVRPYQSYIEFLPLPAHDEDYYGCKRATQYYERALTNATNAEQKAACLGMLAMCQNNYWFYQKMKKEGQDAFYNAPQKNRPNRFFDLLVSKYQSTGYFTAISRECGGRNAFIEGFKIYNVY